MSDVRSDHGMSVELARFLDIRVCSLGFDEISNDLVAIIRIRTTESTSHHRPILYSSGGNCGAGQDLIVRFFLMFPKNEGIVFDDALRVDSPQLLFGACPSPNGGSPEALNPDLWLNNNGGMQLGDLSGDIIHVGTTFIRVSVDSETDLCYRATVPFDSLRPRANPGALDRRSTVEYLLRLVKECQNGSVAPWLRCCVQEDLSSYFRPDDRRYPFDAYQGNDGLGESPEAVWRRARGCEHNWIWKDYEQAFGAKTLPSGSVRVRLPTISSAILQSPVFGKPFRFGLPRQQWGRCVLAAKAPPTSTTTSLLLPDGRILAYGRLTFEEEEWSLTTALMYRSGDDFAEGEDNTDGAKGAFGYRPPRNVGSDGNRTSMSVFVQRTLAFAGSRSGEVWSELSLPVSSAVNLETYALRYPHGGLQRVELTDESSGPTKPREWMDLEYYVRDESSPTGYSIASELSGHEQVAVAYQSPDLSRATACLLPNGDLGLFGGSVNVPRYADGTSLPAGAQQAAIFYARSNSWGALSPAMGNGRSLGGCVVMGDGRVMLMAGETDSGDQQIGYFDEDQRIDRGEFLAEERGGNEKILPLHVVPLRKENLDLEFFYPRNRRWERIRNAAPSISDEPFLRAAKHRPQLIQLPDGNVFCCTPTHTESDGNNGVFNLFVKDQEPIDPKLEDSELISLMKKEGYSPFTLYDAAKRVAKRATRVYIPDRKKWEVLQTVGPSIPPSTSVLLPLYPSTGYRPAILAFFHGYWLMRPDELPEPPWHLIRRKIGEMKFVLPSYTPVLEIVAGVTSVILADGTVATIGGHIADSSTGEKQVLPSATPSITSLRTIEVYDTTDGAESNGNDWDPVHGVWRNGPQLMVARPYSPACVLLPDGRVWISGGETEAHSREEAPATAEFFEPDYLHRGPRPEFRLGESSATYGQPIEIQLRAGWVAEDIDFHRIGLVRIGVCVDGFICDQRYVALSMPEDLPDHEIKTTINLRLRTPPNGNIAPPGVYMVFLRARTTGAISHAQMLTLTC